MHLFELGLTSSLSFRSSTVASPEAQDRAIVVVQTSPVKGQPDVRACVGLSLLRGRLGKMDTRRGLIGSIRRDCLDHVVVFGERHLRHLLNSYQRYYNEVRTHLSLQKDAPISRAVRSAGRVIPVPLLGGLHHQYVRV